MNGVRYGEYDGSMGGKRRKGRVSAVAKGEDGYCEES